MLRRIAFSFFIFILAASAFSFAVARDFGIFPGDLDVSFSDDGLLTDVFSKSDARGYALAVQQDRKVIIAGDRLVEGQSDFGLMRFNEDGTPDDSFGDAGKVVTTFASGFSHARAVAIQPDGMIVAAGFSDTGFALARYLQNGTLDNSFGNNGVVETFGGVGTSIALQPDGKIIVAGYTRSTDDANWMSARYNSDGSLDASFGNGGIVTTSLSSFNDYCYAIALQPDGKLILGGWGGGLALVRYRADGLRDRTFDRDGIVVIDSFRLPDGSANAVAIQADGRIIAAGGLYIGGGHAFALTRFYPNGSIDETFGSGGTIQTTIRGEDSVNSVVIQSDGKIVAAGPAGILPRRFGIARYNTNGSLDPSFGNLGIKTLIYSNTDGPPQPLEVATGVAIDPLQRIVVGGFADEQFALARLIGGTVAPTSLVSVSGRVVTAHGLGIYNARVTLIDPSGQSRTVPTNNFGYFQFDEVPINTSAQYTFTVNAKRYSFPSPSRTIDIQGNVSGVVLKSLE